MILVCSWCCPSGRDGYDNTDLSPNPCHLGRNFDEVMSCFANPPSESAFFNEPRATIYEEEEAKVGTMLFLIPLRWCWDGAAAAAGCG